MARQMTVSLSARQEIIELVNELESRLGTLGASMRAQPQRLRVEAAYHIPFRNQAKVDDTKGVPVTPIEGAGAVDQAIQGLIATRIDQGLQNPRETLRVPGVIALPSDWINELASLNKIKQRISDLAPQIEDQAERTGLWRTWKLLSSLQTMRQVWIVDGPATVRFYWDAAPSIKTQTAQQWIATYRKHLKKLYGYVPTVDELPEGDSYRKFAYGIQKLSLEKPDLRLAAVRLGKPHVRARVTFFDSRKALIRPAPTPIVYSADDPVPLITPLVSWEPKKRATGSRDTIINPEPFDEPLNLHSYL